jgi:hypothetical protein
MRTKVTLVLLFLNVVLFYYIFHFEKKWAAERELQEARRRVLPLEVAGIDSLTRTTRAGEVVRLEKRGESWWLARPYVWPANPNAVSRIVNELNFLEHVTSFAVRKLSASGLSLADYGLDKPAATFAFTAGGHTFELKVGDDTKSGDRLYLLSPDGATIHVVGRAFGATVGLPLESLRAETVFTIPPFEVRSLSVQTAPLKVRLSRDPASGRWRFEAPIVARANKNKVDVTITALHALQARRFIEPREADNLATGLDNPALRVTLEGNTRRETVLIGAALPAPAAATGVRAAADDEHYARVEDKTVVFTIALTPELLEDLSRAQETLRDARILDFDPRTVTSLTLRASNAPDRPELTLQRLEAATASPAAAPARAEAPAAWQLTARTDGQTAQTRPADAARVQALLQKLYLLDARSFLSDAPSDAEVENYGLKSPEREVRLTIAGVAGDGAKTAPTEVVLQIGTSPGQRDAAYARLTNPLYVYRIERDILDATFPLGRRFREHTRELPAGAKVAALKLTDLANGAVLFDRALPVDSVAGSDALARADDPAPRRTALLGLLGELRMLRAKQFVAETFNRERAEPVGGEPRPWKYRLEAILALGGGAGAAQTSTLELLFTERLGGATQLVGTTEFDGVVFEASQALIDAMFTLTTDAPAATAAPPTPASQSEVSRK